METFVLEKLHRSRLHSTLNDVVMYANETYDNRILHSAGNLYSYKLANRLELAIHTVQGAP